MPGVATTTFLKTAVNSVRKHRGDSELDAMQFVKQAREKAGGKVDEVRTLTGRRKLLPPKSKDTFWSRFSAGFLNMVVQGTCADGLKQAMVQLADKLPDETHMIGTVHDELIVECPVKMADEVCRLTEEVMKEAKLPAEVAVEAGHDVEIIRPDLPTDEELSKELIRLAEKRTKLKSKTINNKIIL